MSDLDALLRRVASDSLAPYVIDAWRAVDASARAGTLDRSPVGEAALRHLNLVLADDPVGCTPCPPTALRDAARQRITADRHSKDPLRRYLSLRRSELADLVGKPRQQDARSQAQRTWHDMRRSEALSEAFDRHMIRRASAHVRANPIAGATRVLVDIGGGPGQYVQQIMNHLGADWRALIIESYPSAGWLLRQDGTEIQGRVQLKQDGSWADLPAGAGVYLLGSILHNLGDVAARLIPTRRSSWSSVHGIRRGYGTPPAISTCVCYSVAGNEATPSCSHCSPGRD